MKTLSSEVWIFTADLDARVPRLRDDLELLSQDEKARFERFKVETPARRFVAGRAFLRETLAPLLSTDARSLRFAYGPEGKPSIDAPGASPCNPDGSSRSLELNLSHSAGLALLAVARGRVVGVDVEHVRDSVEIEALARRFFSALERECLLGLPEEQRRRAFFSCWTRKEAYLKARGGGLTIPLDRFDVTLAPGDAPRLLSDRGDPGAPDQWQIHSLSIDPGAEAALVVAAATHESITLRAQRAPDGT